MNPISNQWSKSIIDVDEIGHSILDRIDVRDKIKERFGVEVSSTDRKALGEVVFNNREKMKEYADMSFGLMCDVIDEIIATHNNVIIEWILLPNTKYFDKCDIKILCKRSYENRLKAVMERDNISIEYFETRENNSIEYNEDLFDKIIITNKWWKNRRNAHILTALCADGEYALVTNNFGLN